MFRPDSALKMKFTGVYFAGRQLSVYRRLLSDGIFKLLMDAVELTIDDKPSPERLTDTYFELTHRLLETDVPPGFNGDPWQYHLLSLVLGDDNTFSRQCETKQFHELDAGLKKAAGLDLRNIGAVSALDARSIRHMVRSKLMDLVPWVAELPSFESWPGWDLAPGHTPIKEAGVDPDITLANDLLKTDDWQSKLPDVAQFYRENGAGIFGRHLAFRWDSSETGAYLQGIEKPDPITFNSLVGYNNERKTVIDNTEKLLQGLPANNILLYGERGTGKSSTVKALLHKFGRQGLRLVEVPKQNLSDFPRIIQLLRGRAQKFIVFVDDLSFEENESDYKYLKAILEGGLEAQPQNILIYATSNRRHLVKEFFSDRESHSTGDEIRIQDTMQEKLSLADRFGITVTFTSPSQSEYLAITETLAQQAGLQLPREELHRLALQWEMRYNGRSGRTARQFVDWLTGEKKKRRF
ncbi:MAG: AAA+ family ATPase [Firmicutes bacterium HGW-Firmicutes-14]|nr:MAG: AAA+ family ATPase [Firmicutes bacterium HGW-Firmicutes-14]